MAAKDALKNVNCILNCYASTYPSKLQLGHSLSAEVTEFQTSEVRTELKYKNLQ